MKDFLPVKTPPAPPPQQPYSMYETLDEMPYAGSRFQWRRFLSFLAKLWWIPMLTLVFSLGGAALFIYRLPPTFISTAALWETEKLRLPDSPGFIGDLQNYYGTQMELLQSGRLNQMAFARLEAANSNAVPKEKDGRVASIRVRARQVPKSTVFVLQASSAYPEFAPAFLDAIMSEYLAYKKNVRKTVSGDTLSSISEQVLRLERDLKADQDTLTAFQRTNNLAILQQEGTIAGEYLARLRTQLSDLKLEAQLLDATLREQNSPGATNAVGTLADAIRAVGSGSTPPAMNERQSALRELELLKAQRQKLSEYLRPKHPKIVKLDADIERAQKIIEVYQNQSRAQLATARQAVRMKIDSVEGSISEWEGKVLESNTLLSEGERLKLSVTRSQSLYDRLVMLLQNVDISRNIDQETIAVLEPAGPALRSYRNESMALALAVVVGLGFGVGIVLILVLRDDRFANATEVNNKFAGSIVGQVPEIPQLGSGSALPLLEPVDDRHMYAESYRNLRSALFFLPVEGMRPKVVLVTSALPNEGKSTVAANLAKSIALGGSRVLLVDADLHKGTLHEVLGLQRTPGLAELLRKPGDLKGFFQSNADANLDFLARGRSTPTPSDLFLGAGFDDLLTRLRNQYDFIIIDSCPVFAADDATTLAPKVDGTLFVVRSRYSSARIVQEALELLAQRQAKILGLVFNRANANARSYHYYKYAKYHQSEQPRKPERPIPQARN